MNVEQTLTKDVETRGPADALNAAARLMWERDCGFVPIAEPAKPAPRSCRDGSRRV